MKFKLAIFLTSIVGLSSFVASGPTWSDDVACIIYSHCSSCHNPNGIGPSNYMNYSDVYNSLFAIDNAISSRQMPPWSPDQDFRFMAHSNTLSEDEVTIIQNWISNGAPEGDPANAPAPPVFNTNLEIPTPDFTTKIPDYTVPASTSGDLYKCFVLPTNEGGDKYITGIEIIPGNRNIVHHVLVYQDPTNTPITLDANDPDIGYTCFGNTGSNDSQLIGGWVPGAVAKFTPPGMGILLPANSNLVVQMHFPEGSGGQMDSTRINIQYAPSNTGIRNVVTLPILNHVNNITNGSLFIPANTVQTFHQQFMVPIDMTVTSVAPHAHLICTSMESFAITPLGDTINLVKIPHWDFEWQGFYEYPRPLKIPAGSIVHGYATYDNRVTNPHNPSNPPQDVSAGDATTDEMMVFFFSFLPYLSGDENIITDDASHIDHYNGCQSSVLSLDEHEADQLNLFPNPAQDAFYVQLFHQRNIFNAVVLLHNVNGEKVGSWKLDQTGKINLPPDIKNGIYLTTVFYNYYGKQKQISKRLIIHTSN